MLSAIKSFFAQHAEPDASRAAEEFRRDRVPIAACALMLELAHADDAFTEEEHAQLTRAMMRHFDLPEAKVNELIALAEDEREKSVDLFQFTKLIAESYDEGQKMVLAEILWGLVYSDGKLTDNESYIMRKVSNLLGLSPGYLNEARRRVVGERPEA